MKENNSGGDKDCAQAGLIINEKEFAYSIGQNNGFKTILNDTENAGTPKNADATQYLISVANTLFEERAKVNQDDQSRSKEGGGYALDFDRARDEIGRRMARLRAAL